MTRRFWIGVVSREHVLIGVAGGFAMMNHGKLAPLKRLGPGDGLAYYSPKTAWPEGEVLKAFTAIGTVGDKPPYAAEMPSGQTGFRLGIDWLNARETPISDQTDRLESPAATGACWPGAACSRYRTPISRPSAP